MFYLKHSINWILISDRSCYVALKGMYLGGYVLEAVGLLDESNWIRKHFLYKMKHLQ